MKIFFKLLFLMVLGNSSYASTHTDEKAFNISKQLVSKVVKDIANNGDFPDYLKRTEIGLDVTKNGKPIYDILTVQPLYLNNYLGRTAFTQGRVAYGNDGRTTANLGFGYRFLTLDKKLLLGVNSFYDHEFPYNHQRIGHGVEIKSSAIEFSSNYYNGLSDWHYASAEYVEKALDGYDMEVGIQVPYLPWARIFAKKFYYDGISADNDTNGEQFALRLNPLPVLEIEAGQLEDDASKSTQFVKTTFKMAWGDNSSKKRRVLIDNKAFRFNEDMSDQLLDKVRRSNNIRKERTSTRSSNTTITMVRKD